MILKVLLRNLLARSSLHYNSALIYILQHIMLNTSSACTSDLSNNSLCPIHMIMGLNPPKTNPNNLVWLISDTIFNLYSGVNPLEDWCTECI